MSESDGRARGAVLVPGCLVKLGEGCPSQESEPRVRVRHGSRPRPPGQLGAVAVALLVTVLTDGDGDSTPRLYWSLVTVLTHVTRRITNPRHSPHRGIERSRAERRSRCTRH